MAVLLTKGTKEYLPVTVVDVEETLTSLSSPQYDVQKDDNSYLYQNASGVATGMVVNCLLDLSSTGPGGLIAANTRFRLYIHFANSPEIPFLGPIILRVIDEGQ